MPLPFEPLQVPFRFGLAEGIDPYQAPAGTLSTADNVEWLKSGRLQKRLGANRLPVELGSGSRLFVHRGALCAISSGNLYEWSSSLETWSDGVEVPNVAMEWTTGLDLNDGISSSDAALSSAGHLVQVWRTGAPNDASRRLFVRVLDIQNNTVLLPPTQLDTTASLGCRVVISGTTAFIVHRNAGTIYSIAINLSTLTFDTQAALRTDVRTTSGFDAKIVGTNLVIAYENTPGNALKLYSYSYAASTYTQTASGGVTGEAGNDFRKIAIDGISGERIYVAYYVESSDLIRVATVSDSTMTQVTGPVTQENTASLYAEHVSIVRTGTGGCTVGWSFVKSVTAGPVSRVTTCKIDTTCVQVSGSLRGTWGTRMLSRLFLQDSRVFVFASDYPAPAFTRYTGANSYLLEIDGLTDTGDPYIPHRYVGKLDMFISGTSDYGFLPSAVVVSATESLVPVPFLSAPPQTVANFRCGLRHVRVLTGASLPEDMWRTVEFGGETYMAGGLFCGYDGRAVFDYGVARPVVIGNQLNSAPIGGGTHLAAGDYLYGLVQEWRSYAGILHRSAASYTEQDSGADGETTLYVLTSSLTRKHGSLLWSEPTTQHIAPEYIGYYRSVVNGSNYHRLSYEPNYNTLRKDFRSSSQTIVDNRKDDNIGDGVTTLATRPEIYTRGGILDDEQPPNLLSVALHKSRLWGPSGDRRTIWFSKSFLDDIGVAPGFHADFRVLFDKDVIAVAVLEDKLIPLASDALWYISGDGPAPDGSDSDFSVATPIQTDIGCTKPRSIVTTPAGLVFANESGIYLLTRGLEVVFIGKPIQDTFDAFPIVTSATLVSRRNQIRLTCTNEAGDEGKVLVFDYEEEQWATRTYEGLEPFVSSCMWENRWTALTTDGVIVRENLEDDVAAYLDDGVWVTSTIETTWISKSGPNTYQRVRRAAVLAQEQSDADHTVEIAVNGDDTFVETRLWQSDESFNGRVGIHVKHQKSHAIKLRLSDATPTGLGATVGNGQGFLWSMLALELAQKKGLEKRAEGAKK